MKKPPVGDPKRGPKTQQKLSDQPPTTQPNPVIHNPAQPTTSPDSCAWCRRQATTTTTTGRPACTHHARIAQLWNNT